MPRKKRPLNRDGDKFRDASLIIIASEDTYAPKQYFDRFKTKRVDVQVIPTEGGESSPSHVMDRLDSFVADNLTVDGDTFWLCIDRDRWDEQKLDTVARHCMKKGYGLAISNPCFELWILLHFEECRDQTHETCFQVKERLKALLGGYASQCCRHLAINETMVIAAMDRAKAADNSGNSLVPPPMVTQVYRVLELLRQKERIISFS